MRSGANLFPFGFRGASFPCKLRSVRENGIPFLIFASRSENASNSRTPPGTGSIWITENISKCIWRFVSLLGILEKKKKKKEKEKFSCERIKSRSHVVEGIDLCYLRWQKLNKVARYSYRQTKWRNLEIKFLPWILENWSRFEFSSLLIIFADSWKFYLFNIERMKKRLKFENWKRIFLQWIIDQ